MRIFKSRWFDRFARKHDLSDGALGEAVRMAEAGRVDADYGGGVVKQRIARPHEGKSGGYRSVILYRRGDRAFFVYGFAKSDRANITELEEREFKALAKMVFAFSDEELRELLAAGAYLEVKRDA